MKSSFRGALMGVVAAALGLAGCVSSGDDKPTAKSDTDAASYNLQLGFSYLQQGNLVVAKDKLERAQAQNPRSPTVHSALGMLYERLGDPKRADYLIVSIEVGKIRST